MKPNITDGKYIFLSYAHKNCEQVKRLVETLQSEGYHVWFDTHLELGEKYNDTIGERIQNCEAFMCFLTKEFGESEYCRMELRMAAEKYHKYIVPVYLGNQMKIDEALSPGMVLLISDANAFSIKGSNDVDGFMVEVRKSEVLNTCKGKQSGVQSNPKKHFIATWVVGMVFVILLGIIIGVFVMNRKVPDDTGHDSSVASDASVINNDSSVDDEVDEEVIQEIRQRLQVAEVGDIVEFGTYLQDFDYPTAIEWIVLEKNDDELWLLSKRGLDAKPYDTSGESTTWGNCTLREWLNNDFYNTAFSKEEKRMIPKQYVPPHKNPHYPEVDPSNGTIDKVFLLSIVEVEQYLPEEEDRRCEPTPYALENGAGIYQETNTCWWWLRSPGHGSVNAAYVDFDGSLRFNGGWVDLSFSAVRPSLRLHP